MATERGRETVGTSTRGCHLCTRPRVWSQRERRLTRDLDLDQEKVETNRSPAGQLGTPEHKPEPIGTVRDLPDNPAPVGPMASYKGKLEHTALPTPCLSQARQGSEAEASVLCLELDVHLAQGLESLQDEFCKDPGDIWSQLPPHANEGSSGSVATWTAASCLGRRPRMAAASSCLPAVTESSAWPTRTQSPESRRETFWKAPHQRSWETQYKTAAYGLTEISGKV